MLGIFFTDVFGVQGLRGVTWNHLMPPLCRMCCGHQRHHQGWAALAGLGTNPMTDRCAIYQDNHSLMFPALIPFPRVSASETARG